MTMPRARGETEMVERVARVLLAVSSGMPIMREEQTHSGRAWIDERWHMMTDFARAAISAMRKPTDAMLAVADGFGEYGREPWPEMIDAALNDPPR